MALLFDDKFIFYHICKTGGTSVRQFIANITKNTKEIIREKGKIPNISYASKSRVVATKHCCPMNITSYGGIESFTVIRHPLSWYESIFRRIKGKNSTFFINGNVMPKTFEQFIDSILRIHPYGFVTSMYCRYFPFVDHVLRLENIDDELPNLFRKFGYKKIPDIPIENIGSKFDVSLSEKTRRNILSVELPIINRFYHGADG